MKNNIEKIEKRQRSMWRRNIYSVIFGSDTFNGKLFDVILLWAILASVTLVLLESVHSIDLKFGYYIRVLEWGFTAVFSIEYILRIVSVKKPCKYICSFYGVVDLLAIIPTYLSLIFYGTQYLLVIRSLRLLRVFRILKFIRYIDAAKGLGTALKESRQKITVFMVVILSVVFIMGTIMYIIEGGEHGFTSIPRSIYWAIVTITTVGYGDIAPYTVVGQFLASVLMMMGYVIIAVPTGIVTVEMTKYNQKKSEAICFACDFSDHDNDAKFCKHCGEKL